MRGMWDATPVHSATASANLYPNSEKQPKRVEIPVAAGWKSLPKQREISQKGRESSSRRL